ncbi:MAG: flagellar export protein FliJ [Anaerolineae bacterium]
MGKFRFRLQRVLDYRTSLVEAQEVELAQCMAALQCSLKELAALDQEHQQVLSTLDNRTSGQLRVEPVAATWRYLDALRHKQERVADEVQARQATAAAMREKLVQLKKEEQIMAKLRDRQQARAETAQRRQEVKEIDDLTATRHSLTHTEVNGK